jgi:hypothetical protein
MPDYKEGRVGASTNEWCNSQVRCIGVFRGRGTARNGVKVRWGNFEEISNQLELAVFLTSDIARLCDGGAIVIRCIATRISQVAPVSATVYLGKELDVYEGIFVCLERYSPCIYS